MIDVFHEYLQKHEAHRIDAAEEFTRDLMRGDPATFKAGYSRPSAILATKMAADLTDDEVAALTQRLRQTGSGQELIPWFVTFGSVKTLGMTPMSVHLTEGLGNHELVGFLCIQEATARLAGLLTFPELVALLERVGGHFARLGEIQEAKRAAGFTEP